MLCPASRICATHHGTTGVGRSEVSSVAHGQDALPDKILASGKKGTVQLVDDDGDSQMDSGEESDETTTGNDEHPSSAAGTNGPKSKAPAFTSIGSPNVPSHKELLPLNSRIADASPQKQLKSDPEGDKASGAVNVEGLMDTSENPLK